MLAADVSPEQVATTGAYIIVVASAGSGPVLAADVAPERVATTGADFAVASGRHPE